VRERLCPGSLGLPGIDQAGCTDPASVRKRLCPGSLCLPGINQVGYTDSAGAPERLRPGDSPSQHKVAQG